jgi:tRNA threonylcarbamoyladenosine biosynthesis protein TsaE
MKAITVGHPEELEAVAESLMDYAGGRRIITFEGEIGSGKTTLIKALCRHLEVEDDVYSPTFALINEYRTAKGAPLYHADLYRLKRLEEALDIGIESYLDSGALCFIEWPELISPLLPEEHLRIKLEIVDDSTRKILFL